MMLDDEVEAEEECSEEHEKTLLQAEVVKVDIAPGMAFKTVLHRRYSYYTCIVERVNDKMAYRMDQDNTTTTAWMAVSGIF